MSRGKQQCPYTFTTKGGLHVVVNYGLSFEEMVKMGGYSFVTDKMIPENCPIVGGTGQIPIELNLIQFDSQFVGMQGRVWCEESGFRVANFAELMAFGATYPEEQFLYHIYALGAVWHQSRANDDAIYAFAIGQEEGERTVGCVGPLDFVGGCRDWQKFAVQENQSSIVILPKETRLLVCQEI